MLILITGGAASGKSEYAETIICARARSRLYLATMQPFGSAARARIARHRALREGKGFETLERPLDLPGVALSRQYDGILFEDLGNLLANELFSPDGAKQNSVKSILFGIRKLKENCKTLVVVSNEIFSDGEAYPPGNDGVHPDARGAARPHHAGGRCGFRERLWDFTADKRRF